MKRTLPVVIASAAVLLLALAADAAPVSPTFYIAPHLMVAQQGDEFTLLTGRPGAIITWQTIPSDAARIDSRGRVTVLVHDGHFVIVGSSEAGFDAALVIVTKRAFSEPVLKQIRKKKESANVLKNQQLAVEHRRMGDEFKVQHLRTFLHDLDVAVGSPEAKKSHDAIVARLEDLVHRYADLADVLKNFERNWRDEGAILDSLEEAQIETDALLIAYQVSLARGPQTSPGIPISTDYDQIYHDIGGLLSRLSKREEKLNGLANGASPPPPWDRDASALQGEADAIRNQVATAPADAPLGDVHAMVLRHDGVLAKIGMDATHLMATPPPLDGEAIREKLDAVARVRASLAQAAAIASSYALYQRAWENRSLVAFQPLVDGEPSPDVAKEVAALANVTTADLATREWKVLATQYVLGLDDISVATGASEPTSEALIPLQVGFALAMRGDPVWRKSFDDLTMQPGALTPAESDYLGAMNVLLALAGGGE